MKRLFIFLSFVMATNMWAPSVSELMRNFQTDAAQVGIDVEDAFGAKTKPEIPNKPAHLRPRKQGPAVAPKPRKKGPAVAPKPRKKGPAVAPKPRKKGPAVAPKPKKQDQAMAAMIAARKTPPMVAPRNLTISDDGSFLAVKNKDLHTLNSVIRKLTPGQKDKVRALSFAGNKLQEIPADAIAQFPNVKYLDVSNNEISSIPVGYLQRSLPKIAHLNVSNNSIRSLDEGVFHDLRNLHILDVGNNYLSDVHPSSINLPTWASLREVKGMSDNYIDQFERALAMTKNEAETKSLDHQVGYDKYQSDSSYWSHEDQVSQANKLNSLHKEITKLEEQYIPIYQHILNCLRGPEEVS